MVDPGRPPTKPCSAGLFPDLSTAVGIGRLRVLKRRFFEKVRCCKELSPFCTAVVNEEALWTIKTG